MTHRKVTKKEYLEGLIDHEFHNIRVEPTSDGCESSFHVYVQHDEAKDAVTFTLAGTTDAELLTPWFHFETGYSTAVYVHWSQ